MQDDSASSKQRGMPGHGVGAGRDSYLERVLVRAETRPDDVFCHFVRPGGDITITWSGLVVRARNFAASYRTAVREPGGVVLLFLRHVPDMHGAYLGAMLDGRIPSFMPCTSAKQDPRLYWSSHRELIARIRPVAIVAEPAEFQEMDAAGLDLGGAARIVPDTVGAGSSIPLSLPAQDEIALLQHSSGTTGLKKGVKLSYDAIQRQVESYGSAIGIDGNDVIVSWLPLYHDMGLIACWVLPLFHGTTIVHLDPFDWLARPDELFRRIDMHRGTLCWLPNFAFEHLCRAAGDTVHDLSTVRAFINCSEPCRRATVDRFVGRFSQRGVAPETMQSCYAMAETVFAVSQTRMATAEPDVWVDPAGAEIGSRIPELAAGTPGAMPVLSVGRPIAGAEVAIRDDQGRTLEEGHVGEIAVRGAFLFSGYNLEPERTQERVRGGWYYTRDLGFMRDGRIYVLGRIDDLIIVNGKNVYAHDTEAIAARVPGVKPGRAVAIGLPDELGGSVSLVVIAESDAGRSDRTAIRRRISGEIFGVMGIKPADVRLVEPNWLIKTSSGKMSRRENLAKYQLEFGRGVTAAH